MKERIWKRISDGIDASVAGISVAVKMKREDMER
jgi:hypothetical protein